MSDSRIIKLSIHSQRIGCWTFGDGNQWTRTNYLHKHIGINITLQSRLGITCKLRMRWALYLHNDRRKWTLSHRVTLSCKQTLFVWNTTACASTMLEHEKHPKVLDWLGKLDYLILLTLSLPSSKSTFSQPLQEECVSEMLRIGSIIILHLSKAMKSQILRTMWWHITGEAAGEIWNWS